MTTLDCKPLPNCGQALRAAMKLVLKNNPLLASFFVWDKEEVGSDVALHVVVRQTDAFLDQCIVDYGSVKTVKDLKNLALKYPHPNHAMFPGPLYRALIVEIEDGQTSGFVLNGEFTSRQRAICEI